MSRQPAPGANRRSVGARADQPHGQPVVTVAGVLEQGIVSTVARCRAAGFEEQVHIAVVVPIGECDAVALLEMASARGCRNILEMPALDALE